MADSESQYRRWAELMDRKAMGEVLSADELAFCEQLAADDPACVRELELLDELADLDTAPSPESRALVDAALARLTEEAESAEREEISQLTRPARAPRLLWAIGAAAAVAVAAAAWLVPHKPKNELAAAAQQPGPRVELVYASGEVRVNGKPLAGSSALLDEGGALEVGRGSACLALDPDINVCLGEQSRLRLSRTHSAWRRLDLEAGKVAVQLAPQPDGYRLSVVADGVWSTAVGTAFTVERAPSQGVMTAVLNGKVRVGSDGGHEQMVGAHERSAVLGEQAKVSAISRSEESPEWALLGPSRLWSNPVTASLVVRGLPTGAEVSLDEHVIGVAPLASLVPAGGHTLAVHVDGRLVATREFVCEAGQSTTLSFDGAALPATAPKAASGAPTVVPTATPQALRIPARARVQHRATEAPAQIKAAAPLAPASTPATVVPAASEMLAQARRLLRAERFDQAALAYQALRQSHPESPEARTVLVSLAELQLDRLGQAQVALGNLEQYLGGGHGALVEEARRVRIRALRALGAESQERAAIEEFLAAHPRSFQAAALRQRLAELKPQP
ncbi:MAG: PEGA domain-containing protein [Polyangiales bacterium]